MRVLDKFFVTEGITVKLAKQFVAYIFPTKKQSTTTTKSSNDFEYNDIDSIGRLLITSSATQKKSFKIDRTKLTLARIGKLEKHFKAYLKSIYKANYHLLLKYALLLKVSHVTIITPHLFIILLFS